eukprot:TRINITY_DN21271_c0_g1_i1.p2 TRINITY_DN21271_c0_g1~~TRINITY_DN21271_c0_g1_i1.p2  ORF type:complete len:242 (+),score=38.73 TRINITY_DN21271_c0_g1_i1:77-802(+)
MSVFTPRSVGNKTFRRIGGGGKGGWRGVLTDLYLGGGVPYSLHGQRTCRFPARFQDDYMRRSDLLFSIRSPSKGTLRSHIHSPSGAQNTPMRQLQEAGVRPTNPPQHAGAHKPHVTYQRHQLIKMCEDCYYWTDGLTEYNFCLTKNKSHWHRKFSDADPMEGYKSHGRQGGREFTRKTRFTFPIHRLGTDHPRRGGDYSHWGNPRYGSFDQWLVMRRFHGVGKTSDEGMRYSFQRMFHQEL